MSSVINTNISSLNAQRNLTTSQSALQTSLQRLSSGLRINSAKDDAAGMAISSRMTSQINGLNQAARNANDGISLAQTAEGSLNAISDNLQRMRELAIQSLNGSNSSGDRASMDNEVQQLSQEIDRVAAQTAFNGVKVIDGTFSSQAFQVGANNNETVTINSIASMRTSSLGSSYTATSTGTSNAAKLTSGDLTLTVGSNVFTVGTAFDGTNGKDGTSAYSIANAINAVSSGVTATAGVTSAGGQNASGAALTGTITINGFTTASITTGVGAGADLIAVKAALDLGSSVTGVTATINGTKLDLTAADGRNIDVTFATLTGAVTGITSTAVTRAAVTLTSPTDYTVGGAVAARAGQTNGLKSALLTGTAISSANVLSVTNAGTALTAIDAALASVATARGSLGAYQNRFASVVSNLQTTAENLTASRSRIQDADFAAETAAMTRGQILQQAGTAILAQANSLPNSVLSLLKG